jgi:hypothetical protein
MRAAIAEFKSRFSTALHFAKVDIVANDAGNVHFIEKQAFSLMNWKCFQVNMSTVEKKYK